MHFVGNLFRSTSCEFHYDDLHSEPEPSDFEHSQLLQYFNYRPAFFQNSQLLLNR